MTELILAEDLLLLLLDDDSGKMTNSTFLDIGIGGALLIDLALAGAVELTAKQKFRQQKVVPSDPSTTGNQTGGTTLSPMLAEALVEVSEKERSATSLIARLGKHRRGALLDRLEADGILRREHDKVLGLFSRTRWPAQDIEHETEVRRKISQALHAGHTADKRTAGLISLISAMGLISKVIDIEGLSRRDLNKRAKAIADGDWASKAVRDAVAATQAAMVAAIGTVAASSS